MKITIAIDSFKGSMTSLEAGNAAKEGVLQVYPNVDVTVYPVADGGEGTVEALASRKFGQETAPNTTEVITRSITVTDPLGEKIPVSYYMLCKHDIDTQPTASACNSSSYTAIIEMSSAAGLPLVPPDKRNPLHTTTYGVGEMIKDAINQGCRDFIIGIGGSATNDCGIGMLQALGYRFVDSRGNDVPFGAEGLGKIQDIYFEEALPVLSECNFRIACDVTNPLVGENGCSAVFSPQKGATPEMVKKMDLDMTRFANLVEHIAMCDESSVHFAWLKKCEKMKNNRAKCAESNKSYEVEYVQTINRNTPGTGAAGGLGYAFLMFLNATLEPGVDIVLSEIGIEEDIKTSDLIITGEGKIDAQTINGKTPAGVASLAKKYGKKVIAFAGLVDKSSDELKKQGLIDEIYEVERGTMDLETAMQTDKAYINLKNMVANYFEKKTGKLMEKISNIRYNKSTMSQNS